MTLALWLLGGTIVLGIVCLLGFLDVLGGAWAYQPVDEPCPYCGAYECKARSR